MKDLKINLAILATPEQSQKFSIIQCGFISMLITSSPVFLPAGHQDKHDHFEFVIPLSPIQQLFIEHSEINCQPGQLIPVNPGQLHGVRQDHPSVSYILIFFERERMTSLIRKIYGSASGHFPNETFFLKNEIQEIISDLIHEKKANKAGSSLMLNNMAEQLTLMMIRFYFRLNSNHLAKWPENLTDSQNRFQAVIAFMHEKYGSRITLDDFAAICEMNIFHFIRSFKKSFQLSPYSYLIRIRIEYAKKLLTTTKLPASEVGRRCGFPSASRFSAVFLRSTGLTPSDYRKSGVIGL